MSRRGVLRNPLPLLDRPTEAALRASIENHGVVVPVVRDQHGRTLDGHHRERIAAELGVHCPAEVVEVRDDDHARELAAELNLARRHMSVEQRRAVVASLRGEGHSLRAIAGAVGAHERTVRRDLDTAGAARAAPDRTQGRDGKKYPARRRRRSPRPVPPPQGTLLVVHLAEMLADVGALEADPHLLARVVPDRDRRVTASHLRQLAAAGGRLADMLDPHPREEATGLACPM